MTFSHTIIYHQKHRSRKNLFWLPRSATEYATAELETEIAISKSV